VHRDAVVADYAMSNERLLAVLRRGVGAEYEIDPADIELYRCPPEVMVALLGDLDAIGAAEGWLRERGLAEHELDRLRARFLSG
jgi:hypothetical protein